MVSRKPLVSHCAVRATMSRSTINTGSATLMIVSLRIMTNAENTSSAMTTPALGSAFGRTADRSRVLTAHSWMTARWLVRLPRIGVDQREPFASTSSNAVLLSRSR